MKSIFILGVVNLYFFYWIVVEVWWGAPALWCSGLWGVKVCIGFALSERLWARIYPSPCLAHKGKRWAWCRWCSRCRWCERGRLVWWGAPTLWHGVWGGAWGRRLGLNKKSINQLLQGFVFFVLNQGVLLKKTVFQKGSFFIPRFCILFLFVA